MRARREPSLSLFEENLTEILIEYKMAAFVKVLSLGMCPVKWKGG